MGKKREIPMAEQRRPYAPMVTERICETVPLSYHMSTASIANSFSRQKPRSEAFQSQNRPDQLVGAVEFRQRLIQNLDSPISMDSTKIGISEPVEKSIQPPIQNLDPLISMDSTTNGRLEWEMESGTARLDPYLGGLTTTSQRRIQTRMRKRALKRRVGIKEKSFEDDSDDDDYEIEANGDEEEDEQEEEEEKGDRSRVVPRQQRWVIMSSS